MIELLKPLPGAPARVELGAAAASRESALALAASRCRRFTKRALGVAFTAAEEIKSIWCRLRESVFSESG